MNRLRAAVRKELTAGPMATKGFPLLLAGQFTSSIGDLCYAVALPWLILSNGGSPVLLGTVLACYGVARTVGIPVGGILADRFGARQIMLTTDMVRFAVVALLGVVALDGQPHIALLAPIAVLVGACEGFFLPASFALLPSLLPEKELGAGNSLSSIATQGGSLLGPVVGGVLVATVGPGPALLVDALTFAVSAATLYAMRPVTKTTTTDDDEDVEAEPAVIPATFGEVLRRGRLLHIILGIGLIGNLVYAGAAEVALPTLAHRDFGAAGYGILLLGLGGGMIVGAVLARRDWVGDQPAPFIAVLGLVMAVAIGTVPFVGGLAGAVICMTLFAVANSWSGIVIMTMLQVWTPRHVLARVMSVLMLALTGTFPISVAITGFGVDRYGVTAFFPVAGAAIALGILGAFSRPAFRRYRTGDRFPQVPVAAQTEGT